MQASKKNFTVEQYKGALRAVRDTMTESQRLMLEAHFLNGKISAEQLADAAGVKGGYGFLYAPFCISLAEKLGIYPLPKPRVHAIVDDDGRDSKGHLLMELKPEVSQALRELGWFGPPQRKQ
jgi:hypothetical protein